MAETVCEACGAPVVVEAGVIRRTCGHEKAGVIARLVAVLRGSGGIVHAPPGR